MKLLSDDLKKRLTSDGKEYVESVEKTFERNIERLKKGSVVLAQCAEKTGIIVAKGADDIVSGRGTSADALIVARRGTEQLEDIIRGEGNLAAVAALDTLKEMGLGVLKIIGRFIGL